MNKLKHYDIAYKALKVGTYQIDFELKQELFEEFDSQSQGVLGGNGNVAVVINRNSNSMLLNFHVDAEIEVSCDMCLESFMYHVDYEDVLTVRFAQENDDHQGDVIMLSVEEDYLNVAQFIYEYINYGLPFKRVHPKGANGKPGCDTEMLERISQHLVGEEEGASDPRWDALRKLSEN